VLGKGFTKVMIQCALCVLTFSKTFFDTVMFMVDRVDIGGWGMSRIASFLRSTVMAKFELQKRFTAEGFLKLMDMERLHASGHGRVLVSSTPTLDQTSLAQKYCAMGSPPLCGKILSGSDYDRQWEKSEQWQISQLTAARVLSHLDTDGSSTLDLAELTKAESLTDGKFSLASIDPGEGGLFSLGKLWNGFIAALILFFVITIVEEVAKVQQNVKDAKELQALESSLKTNAKKVA